MDSSFIIMYLYAGLIIAGLRNRLDRWWHTYHIAYQIFIIVAVTLFWPLTAVVQMVMNDD